MPPLPASPEEILELRQRELRQMAQQLVLLAEQMRLREQAMRSMHAAEQRELELRDAHRSHTRSLVVPFCLGAITGISLGAAFINARRLHA